MADISSLLECGSDPAFFAEDGVLLEAPLMEGRQPVPMTRASTAGTADSPTEENERCGGPRYPPTGLPGTLACNVSVVPSNTPVLSPSKFTVEEMVQSPLVSFTQPRVLFKETKRPESACVKAGVEDVDSNNLSCRIPSATSGYSDKPFGSPLKGFSAFPNSIQHNHNQQYDIIDASTFENDILDVSFRNNVSMDYTTKSPHRGSSTFNSMADTLLSFRNQNRDFAQDRFDYDSSGGTINLPFSSSPTTKLNLKINEASPLNEIFNQFERFPDYADLGNNDEEDTSNSELQDTDCEVASEEKERNKSDTFRCESRSDGEIEEYKQTMNVTLKFNENRPVLPRLRPLISNSSPSRQPIVLPLPELHNVAQHSQKNSNTRFEESSGTNYGKRILNESSSRRTRDQRREMRLVQRSGKPSTSKVSNDLKIVPLSPTSVTDPTYKEVPGPHKRKPHFNQRQPPSISRSRNGCWTCRIRKKKCTEERPSCSQCEHLDLKCDGYSDEKPDFITNMELQRKKLDDIKKITSQRKKFSMNDKKKQRKGAANLNCRKP